LRVVSQPTAAAELIKKCRLDREMLFIRIKDSKLENTLNGAMRQERNVMDQSGQPSVWKNGCQQAPFHGALLMLLFASFVTK
jgi:hypothetical protein